jgi:hypothetical protein
MWEPTEGEFVTRKSPRASPLLAVGALVTSLGGWSLGADT